jgi:hypothetical protein
MYFSNYRPKFQLKIPTTVFDKCENQKIKKSKNQKYFNVLERSIELDACKLDDFSPSLYFGVEKI